MPGFLVLLALPMAAPWPYGGVLPGGTLSIELLCFLSAALAFLPSPSGEPLGAARLPALCVAGIAALGFVQLAPLPASLLAGVAPVSLQVYRETNELLAVFGRPPVTPRISIAPADTLATALFALACVAAFVAAARLLVSRARRRLFVAALVVSALWQLGAGAAEEGSGEAGRVHGAFLNPDHLAGFLEVPLALAFGLLWVAIRHRLATRSDRRYERQIATIAAALLLWATLAAGVGLTRSRGGILAGLLTALVLLVLSVARHGRGRAFRTATAGAIVLAVGVAYAALITRKGPLLRFLETDPRYLSEDFRARLWRTSLEAVERAPVLGTGLGTFREAFRRVQPADLPGLIEQAHNDFLQLLVTAGLLGGLLGALAVVSAGRLLLHGWLRQKQREERMLALGAFGALFSLTLHGVVDFNLSIPATAAVLSAVVGAGLAAGRATEAARTSRRSSPSG